MGKKISSIDIDINKIRDACKILSKSSIRKIDLLKSNTFSGISGNNVYLKLECFQKTGSFKVRGATTMLYNLPEDLKKNGVIAASAGNHAQGVAFASRMNNVDCTIVMPRNASPAKISATKSYGAKVILDGANYDEAYDLTKKIAERENKTIIPAFNHPDIIAGQGTIGLEILEDLDQIDEVHVPVGGGGLISGVALALKAVKPKIKVIGVQSKAFPAISESIRENRIVKVQRGHTIADGISVKLPGELTFEIIKEYVDDIVLVDDLSIVKTMFLLMERSKVVAEPAGAISLAYLLRDMSMKANEERHKGKNIVSIISGGNVDMYLLGQVVAKGLMQTGRMVKLFVELTDKPGALKGIVDEITNANVNIVEVVHDRLSSNIPAGTAGVYLSLELENKDQAKLLVSLLRKQKINFKIVN
ncbi:MAG: threonine ammonia-lyase [Thermoproteota archaeon]|nr:threonine ammonia-lyase [Thermoproteota archaeon]